MVESQSKAFSNSPRRSIFIAMVGNALESYDVVLYGYFAALISPFFFPAHDPSVSVLVAMGAFAVSFIMRPLGGIIFGHFGDRVGRKRALLFSIVTISFPTILIGFLPSYHYIGIFAPVILLLALVTQGMCAGGAYSGAAIFINEHAKQGREGFASSLLSTSGFFGAVLVTGLGSLFTMSFMPAWAWRIPFFLGGIAGVSIYMLRHIAEETPAFNVEKQKRELERVPFIEAIKKRKLNMLCSMGIGGAAFIPFYLVSVYMNMFLTTKMHMPSSTVLLINMLTMLLWIIFLPIMGHLSDRIGQKRLMLSAALCTILVAYPVFYFFAQNASLKSLFIIQFVLSLIASAFVAPSSAFLPKLFGVRERYSGLAFSYFLGVALFGGTTPLIAASLVEWTGSIATPSHYLFFGGVLGYISVKYARRAS